MLSQNTYTRTARYPIGRAECAAVFAITLFNLWSLLLSVRLRNTLYILASTASLVLVYAPYLAQRLLRVRISIDLKLTYMALAVCGPVLGNVYKCYYTVPYFDKVLHTLSGYAFAALGFCLPDILEKRREGHSLLLKCAFALCFSITVAALWEFYEYGADTFLHMDMQNDTVITDISSYMLGAQTGEIGSITGIGAVSIDGAVLPVAGYLDIGLIDTMDDMLVCFLGAVAYCAVKYLCRNIPEFASITRARESVS